jgi:hypothetical protein
MLIPPLQLFGELRIAKIGFDYLGVVRYDIRRAFGKFPSEI